LFGASRQGDGAFPDFLARLAAGEKLSLRGHPDLAPPLWAAAALGRRRLEVVDTPQLKWKESDRAGLLVAAALALGAEAFETPGGFVADFRAWVPSGREVFLRTDGDHRLAMAFGLVGYEEAGIAPDRRDCVKKSFPAFWTALDLLQEALPG
jgi:5-enolpyruvylshikimate-3-phosphate synthase